jgi:hypothetical protein
MFAHWAGPIGRDTHRVQLKGIVMTEEVINIGAGDKTVWIAPLS